MEYFFGKKILKFSLYNDDLPDKYCDYINLPITKKTSRIAHANTYI